MFSFSAAGARGYVCLIAATAVGLLALADCGGGGDDESGPSDDAIRAKLQTAADRLATVRALEARVSVEASEEDSTETTSACIGLAIGRGEKTTADDQVALRTYDGGCYGDPGAEVIIIGRDVWASQPGDRWAAARVDPSLVAELTDEEEKYEELLAAATDLRPGEEPNSYEFSAPASAFSQTEDLGDTDVDVDFVLTLGRRGYLRSLVGTVEVEGAKAVVDTSYEIGDVGPIEPPPAADVVGSVQRIGSKAELEGLLGPTFSSGFE